MRRFKSHVARRWIVYAFVFCILGIANAFWVNDRQDAQQNRETKTRIHDICADGNERSASLVAFIAKDLADSGYPVPQAIIERAERRFPQKDCSPEDE